MTRWMLRAAVSLIAVGWISSASARVAQRPAAPAGQRPIVVARPMQPAQRAQLDGLVSRHNQTRAALPADVRTDLDRLSEFVRLELFARPLPGNVYVAAKQIMSGKVPGLTDGEAGSLAGYCLDNIAAGDAIGPAAAGGSGQDQLLKATKSMQETQMSFNLQYLQLQSQMQHENRSYTAISNIMKTKHDTVKNSISNVR